jgi:hypothetical protein
VCQHGADITAAEAAGSLDFGETDRAVTLHRTGLLAFLRV